MKQNIRIGVTEEVSDEANIQDVLFRVMDMTDQASLNYERIVVKIDLEFIQAEAEPAAQTNVESE